VFLTQKDIDLHHLAVFVFKYRVLLSTKSEVKIAHTLLLSVYKLFTNNVPSFFNNYLRAKERGSSC